MTARANCLLATADLFPADAAIEPPVFLADAILDGVEEAGRFEYVVGNPPWIAWDNLPEPYRRATRPLWERYGLFSLSASAARHGGAKKDLSMLVLYRAADRFLAAGGRLGMVVTQTLFQSKGAGDGFRRFRLGPEGEPLRVDRVDDMAAIKPFPGAANWTATIALTKGSPTEYPLPYVVWTPAPAAARRSSVARRRGRSIRERPGSPWSIRLEGMDAAELSAGPSDYTAHLGANSGGANAIYWLELLGKRGRRRARPQPRRPGEAERARRRASRRAGLALSAPPLGRRAALVGAAAAHILLAQDPHCGGH